MTIRRFVDEVNLTDSIGGANVAEFAYRAVDINGGTSRGKICAESREVALNIIREQGLFPLDVNEVRQEAKSRHGQLKGRRNAVLLAFTEQLASLLNAGISLDRALGVMSASSGRVRGAEIARSIRKTIREGSTLADALTSVSRDLFPGFYVGAVRAGEASGTLGEVLSRLNGFLQQQTMLYRELISSLVYPSVTLSFAIVAIVIMLVYLVPSFSSLLSDTGQTLPKSTRVLVWLGQNVSRYWWLALLAGLQGAVVLLSLRRSNKGRLYIERALLALPAYGGVRLMASSARFLRTLSILLENGIPLVGAYSIAVEAAGNLFLQTTLMDAFQGIKRGQDLSSQFQRTGLFDVDTVQIVQVGEETGKLGLALEKAASDMERRLRSRTRYAMTLLEPTLLLITAGVVAFVALSMLLPILSLSAFGSWSRH